ncbi:glycosyltransferase family 2 protein [Telluribacter humicola]|uniref:glycosyltransferase family 2 protein n=1 Tax=Telluribacter humicola TaxID=1720261 RepID=UPI001A959D47|nr:glycosyltransferase family 2 protein [Telluribacter humicola]
MKIAIVLAIHNSLDYTKLCLINLSNLLNKVENFISYEIIIIDDGSVDESEKWIKEHFPNIHILKGNGSLWWSGAMNKGLKYSFNVLSCDYALCWNNDIIAEKEYFNNLPHEIKRLNKLEFLCSKILYKDKNDNDIIFSCGCRFNTHTGLTTIIGNKALDSDLYNHYEYVDWSGGMGMLITRDLYEKIGPFNNNKFPQYKGDADFCLRAKEHGFKLMYSPNLVIYNDPTHSGINNKYDNLKLGIQLLYSKRSIYNLKLNYDFYMTHCRTRGILLGLTVTYTRYFILLLKIFANKWINNINFIYF